MATCFINVHGKNVLVDFINPQKKFEQMFIINEVIIKKEIYFGHEYKNYVMKSLYTDI